MYMKTKFELDTGTYYSLWLFFLLEMKAFFVEENFLLNNLQKRVINSFYQSCYTSNLLQYLKVSFSFPNASSFYVLVFHWSKVNQSPCHFAIQGSPN